MAKIEGLRVKNFKALKDITLGRFWTDWKLKSDPLTPMTAVIGKNGVGKSSLFDAFGFLADCLKLGVEEACDVRGRGGYRNILSQGVNDPIEFEVYYKEERNTSPITYELSIGIDETERPFVHRERIRQRRIGQKTGRPFSFLILENGRGVVWKGDWKGSSEGWEDKGDIDLSGLMEFVQEEPNETEVVELNDNRKLGIATLGSLKQHPRISAFRRFIEGWYLSYFAPDVARGIPMAGPQKHLNVHGDNLGNVVQFMEREHKKRFQAILQNITEKIPGINKIETTKLLDNRLLLKFRDKGFKDPFYVQQMSDGTLKIFAYLLLLDDPNPPPFLCIEEPEKGLYHKLLESLAREFREHAQKRGGAQVFVTTHQPYFVDALEPKEVWILDKGADGFSKIRKASDDPVIVGLVEEGLPLGALWYSDYLEEK